MIPSNSVSLSQPSHSDSDSSSSLWLTSRLTSCSLQVIAAAQAPCPHRLQLTSAITLTFQCPHVPNQFLWITSLSAPDSVLSLPSKCTFIYLGVEERWEVMKALCHLAVCESPLLQGF